MDLFQIALITATLLCALVAGLVFTFAIIVMPGLATLDDRGYLQGFKTLDGVIQRGQPLFALVWLGSAVAIVVAAGLSFGQLEGLDRLLLIKSAVLYILAVQLPTFAINIPLNNQLKDTDLSEAEPEKLANMRQAFDGRWAFSNNFRTVAAIVCVILQLFVLLRV